MTNEPVMMVHTDDINKVRIALRNCSTSQLVVNDNEHSDGIHVPEVDDDLMLCVNTAIDRNTAIVALTTPRGAPYDVFIVPNSMFVALGLGPPLGPHVARDVDGRCAILYATRPEDMAVDKKPSSGDRMLAARDVLRRRRGR